MHDSARLKKLQEDLAQEMKAVEQVGAESREVVVSALTALQMIEYIRELEQYAEWMQGECDKAVEALEQRNSEVAKIVAESLAERESPRLINQR